MQDFMKVSKAVRKSYAEQYRNLTDGERLDLQYQEIRDALNLCADEMERRHGAAWFDVDGDTYLFRRLEREYLLNCYYSIPLE